MGPPAASGAARLMATVIKLAVPAGLLPLTVILVPGSALVVMVIGAMVLALLCLLMLSRAVFCRDDRPARRLERLIRALRGSSRV